MRNYKVTERERVNKTFQIIQKIVIYEIIKLCKLQSNIILQIYILICLIYMFLFIYKYILIDMDIYL